jgi:transcriptional regulator with XRE-family HTH domain
MRDEKFLRAVHGAMGIRKLDGVRYKDVARRCRISKQLLSQYLNGDLEVPSEIRKKIIEFLGIGDYVS